MLRFFFDRAKSDFASEQVYRPRCKEDYLDIIKRVLTYIRKNKHRLQLLVKARLEYIYTDYVSSAMNKTFSEENENVYLAAGYAGMISAITLRWIMSDCTDDESNVLEAFSSIALAGMGD